MSRVNFVEAIIVSAIQIDKAFNALHACKKKKNNSDSSSLRACKRTIVSEILAVCERTINSFLHFHLR